MRDIHSASPYAHLQFNDKDVLHAFISHHYPFVHSGIPTVFWHEKTDIESGATLYFFMGFYREYDWIRAFVREIYRRLEE